MQMDMQISPWACRITPWACKIRLAILRLRCHHLRTCNSPMKNLLSAVTTKCHQWRSRCPTHRCLKIRVIIKIKGEARNQSTIASPILWSTLVLRSSVALTAKTCRMLTKRPKCCVQTIMEANQINFRRQKIWNTTRLTKKTISKEPMLSKGTLEVIPLTMHTLLTVSDRLRTMTRWDLRGESNRRLPLFPTANSWTCKEHSVSKWAMFSVKVQTQIANALTQMWIWVIITTQVPLQPTATVLINMLSE